MTFFPPDPEMSDAEAEPTEFSAPRWWDSPDDELPALLPVSELLASTDHVAIALSAVAVYREGVEFRIDRRLRRNGLSLREWNELCSTFMEHMTFGGPVDLEGRFRFGLVLGDGEKVLPDPSGFPGGGDDAGAAPEGHVLNRRQQGGGGGSSVYESRDHLWLWPLPPDGPIELVIQWPALGIEETRIVLDGTAMLALKDRARPFWP